MAQKNIFDNQKNFAYNKAHIYFVYRRCKNKGVPEGFTKATAIDVILEAYGLTLEDAYVFGDSTNDIAMFEHVPNAVLMGRHSPELEPYASFLTKTVEQDGIWYAMEKLGLLSEDV